jgi:serine/threonine protein phosphatase PrpC
MGNSMQSAPPVVASKLPMGNGGVAETPSAEQGAYARRSMEEAFGAPIIFMGVSDEQGPRPYMEDRHTLIKNFDLGTGAQPVPRSFIAVYDGHSSSRGAAHAARRLHEIIAQQQAVRAARGGKEEQPAVEEALKAAFEHADEEIIGEAQRTGRRYGSTAVCAFLVEGTLYVAHCGDSRAVLFRAGAAVPLTRDHKPASVEEERQRIEAAGETY